MLGKYLKKIGNFFRNPKSRRLIKFDCNLSANSQQNFCFYLIDILDYDPTSTTVNAMVKINVNIIMFLKNKLGVL